MRRAFRAILKGGVLFLLFGALAVLVRYIPSLDENALALYVCDKGALGVAAYIAATALGSALGVPRQGLSFVGGYAFGAAAGLAFATIGTTFGCAGSFFVSRHLGRRCMPERFLKRMEKFDSFVSSAPFFMTLTIRCLPVGSNALTNLLAGLSSIPAFGFIAGSFVGYIPQNLIFSLLGSGMRVDPFWRLLAAGLLFGLAFVLGAVLYRRHKTLVGEVVQGD